MVPKSRPRPTPTPPTWTPTPTSCALAGLAANDAPTSPRATMAPFRTLYMCSSFQMPSDPHARGDDGLCVRRAMEREPVTADPLALTYQTHRNGVRYDYPRITDTIIIVRSETVIGWHRAGFR